jgi:hypothetical protein
MKMSSDFRSSQRKDKSCEIYTYKFDKFRLIPTNWRNDVDAGKLTHCIYVTRIPE